MRISEEYPELFQDIKEMPLKVAKKSTKGVNIKVLNDNHDSPTNLPEDYSKTQTK